VSLRAVRGKAGTWLPAKRCILKDRADDSAGIHAFNGSKSGTLPLAPGSHAIEIDYMQVHTRLSKSVSTPTTHAHISDRLCDRDWWLASLAQPPTRSCADCSSNLWQCPLPCRPLGRPASSSRLRTRACLR